MSSDRVRGLQYREELAGPCMQRRRHETSPSHVVASVPSAAVEFGLELTSPQAQSVVHPGDV